VRECAVYRKERTVLIVTRKTMLAAAVATGVAATGVSYFSEAATMGAIEVDWAAGETATAPTAALGLSAAAEPCVDRQSHSGDVF
jgi:hypothetical protein